MFREPEVSRDFIFGEKYIHILLEFADLHSMLGELLVRLTLFNSVKKLELIRVGYTIWEHFIGLIWDLDTVPDELSGL